MGGLWGSIGGLWGSMGGYGVLRGGRWGSMGPYGAQWGRMGRYGGTPGWVGRGAWPPALSPPLPQDVSNESAVLELRRPMAGPREVELEVELLPGAGLRLATPTSGPNARPIAALRLRLMVGEWPF